MERDADLQCLRIGGVAPERDGHDGQRSHQIPS
jgi:hypothetical protein